MTHTYHSPILRDIAADLQNALSFARAPQYPFSITNHIHAAIAQIEQADAEMREADGE